MLSLSTGCAWKLWKTEVIIPGGRMLGYGFPLQTLLTLPFE